MRSPTLHQAPVLLFACVFVGCASPSTVATPKTTFATPSHETVVDDRTSTVDAPPPTSFETQRQK
ncbi:MAG: hypothetical protein ABIP94_24830, partial [Planctomycetota bacterium]